MSIEGDRDAPGVSLLRPLHGPADDLLVAEMHTVEEPDRDDRRAGGQRKGVETPDDVHRRWRVPVKRERG